jgi:ribosomal protein S18 acetylase RimI-like enzyme
VVTKVQVRRLAPENAAEYRAIRLAALEGAPEAFGSTYESEAARPPGDFEERLRTSAVFAGSLGGVIVGMAGLKQEDGAKRRHKAFLWGVFVLPEARGRGVGAALIGAAVAAADGFVEQVTLTVVRGNDAAVGLYRGFGFDTYGIEPRALKTGEEYLDQLLMVRFAGGRAPR